MQPSFRGYRGMQIHAVPESERAFDASGRKLPWGYSVSASAASNLETRDSIEKGPFGRSQRRSRSGLSRSRSKTAEPRREEDRIKAEQLAAEDAVFGSLRKVAKDESRREPVGDADVNSVSQPGPGAGGEKEATEVLLYGFGEELQWSAIDHFERVSGGDILEDYERQPAGRRYDNSRSYGRANGQRSLSRAALKKKNIFAGGEHWIKVTFDSRGAAELACARSPHIIKGHLVYAEPYQGRGPGRDEAIPASNAGAQIASENLPSSFSTNTLNASPSGSSTTVTSATATARQDPLRTEGSQGPSNTLDDIFAPRGRPPTIQQQPTTQITQTSQGGAQLTLRRPRIEGATPATILPASAAILPRQHQSWSAWLGTSDLMGADVPRKEDGSFDHDKATYYWRLFFLIDRVLGTDFCGLKAD